MNKYNQNPASDLTAHLKKAGLKQIPSFSNIAFGAGICYIN
jgi:hypothetical protein